MGNQHQGSGFKREYTVIQGCSGTDKRDQYEETAGKMKEKGECQ
jgi:hypothetical protein